MIAYSLTDPNYANYPNYTLLCGGAADKFIPMSDIHGLRIIISCENVVGSSVQNGLRAGAGGDVANLCSY